ncbi:hypothetical protein BN7_2973 [Wickerhamomyces ciferrii]|uniref:UEV domain-containing protein n=1 Tax=Wickerhamomyces ciferrii (strain ATCC 14091 / BCRC 22168 / CBS 111 / JCM 3599 / NBRC 0793 / NRRL Y-1031 F-60-10) TaxID=1206466 RepID=K0KE88_WICCF|nr:uncharacterized protein BN7_2973 [Wickerhamomyces ciferrii]CCH43425.1 hypothetical protein BN7_2973 [Wickerhamomyces ciferrii]
MTFVVQKGYLEYIDPRLTYHDVATTLQSYPTLKPRTRVYTSETGESQLLLCLYGSIPSPIGGKIYKIPIELWVPHEYPLMAPFVYVVPTEKMILQPGNHVDNSGRCYLPYLANWGSNNNEDNNGQSTIVKLCEHLSKIFGLEPPVFAKPISKPTTPIISQRIPSNQQQQQQQQPSPHPTLPPKIKESDNVTSTASSASASPPPLPPLPNELRSKVIQSPTLNKRDHLFNQPVSIDQQISSQNNKSSSNTFEQPNIMDTDNTDDSNGGVDPERQQILGHLNSLLQQINHFEILEDSNRISSNVLNIKNTIEKFDKIFQYEYKNLDSTEKQIKENELILHSSIDEAQKVINESNGYGDLNIDEIICGETMVFNQYV